MKKQESTKAPWELHVYGNTVRVLEYEAIRAKQIGSWT